MKNLLPAFRATVGRLLALLESVPVAMIDRKPRPEDWSIKEIACHLVDSASNNHQRFTRLQRARRVELPAYETEPWVAVEKPTSFPWQSLFDLVRSYNEFVLHLVANLEPSCLQNVWVCDGKELTLDHLARDYYRHIEWHIAHLEQRIGEVRAMPP